MYALCSAGSPECYDKRDMSNGPSGTVFRVLCKKISTGQEKLALIDWHDWHVFATLVNDTRKVCSNTATLPLSLSLADCSKHDSLVSRDASAVPWSLCSLPNAKAWSLHFPHLHQPHQAPLRQTCLPLLLPKVGLFIFLAN